MLAGNKRPASVVSPREHERRAVAGERPMRTPLLARLRASSRVLPLVFYRAVGGGTPVLVGFYIAHRWGLAEFGSYTVAMAAVTIGQVITDWGCSRMQPREIAVMDQSAAAAFVSSTNVSRLFIFIVLGAAAWIASSTSFLQPSIAHYLWILAPWPLVTIWSTNGISARVVDDETTGIGIAAVMGLVALAILVFLGRRSALGPYAVAWAYIGAKCVETVILVGNRWWLLGIRGEHMIRVLRVLWPFSIQGILLVIYSRLPLFVIEHSGTAEMVGVVSAGTALQSVLLLLPACTSFIALPQLTVAVAQQRSRIRPIIYNYLVTSIAGIGCGAAGLVLLRHVISRLLRIPETHMAFVIAFAVTSVVTLGTAILSVLLQAWRGEATVARIATVTVLLAVVYQLTLVRLLGVWGLIPAIIAAEISSVFLLYSAYVRVQRSGRAPVSDPVSESASA